VHHQPDIENVTGGNNTSRNLINHTLELYKETFGHEAPIQYWGVQVCEQLVKTTNEESAKTNHIDTSSKCYTCRGCFTNSDKGGKSDF
jgi:hypothetical protein